MSTSVIAKSEWSEMNFYSQVFIMAKKTDIISSFQVIYNVTVVHEGAELKYAQLCAQWNQYCYDNEILRMAGLMPDIESGDVKITYPVFFDPYSFETYALSIFFGGTVLNDDEVNISFFNEILHNSWHLTSMNNKGH